MDEVVLARADRGQVWKPLRPFAVTLVLCAALVWWVGDAEAVAAASLCVVAVGGVFVGRTVLWSRMGDLLECDDALLYRPRRGKTFSLAWQDVRYAHLAAGVRVLPHWYVETNRGPLPVLHLHLRKDLRHDFAPGCVQARGTPGLEGRGPHADRDGWAVWELSLLVRPGDLREVERRLLAAFELRGIPFDGPTLQARRPTAPWEPVDDQDAESG